MERASDTKGGETVGEEVTFASVFGWFLIHSRAVTAIVFGSMLAVLIEYLLTGGGQHPIRFRAPRPTLALSNGNHIADYPRSPQSQAVSSSISRMAQLHACPSMFVAPGPQYLLRPLLRGDDNLCPSLVARRLNPRVAYPIMPKDTLTFELGGAVDIGQLENAISKFHRLVRALTPKKAGVTWVVDDLHAGSAIATVRGEAADPIAVERIVEDYEHVGATLREGGSLEEFGRRVSTAAEAVREITAHAGYVRLATLDGEYILSNVRMEYEPSGTTTTSIGSITGRVETLSSHGRLRFNLYDSVFNRAVPCYLTKGQEERMREVWGKLARVSGHISREPGAGRPISISRILDIEVLPEIERGAFRQARGAIPWHPDYEGSEEAIRKVRDA